MRATINSEDVHEVTVVVRTGYSNDVAWRAVVALLEAPTPNGYETANHFVDDPTWAGADVDEVLAALPDNVPVVFIADADAMRGHDVDSRT